jgi:ATP-binding cassette, subfamily B (MDR/TAP), member 1
MSPESRNDTVTAPDEKLAKRNGFFSRRKRQQKLGGGEKSDTDDDASEIVGSVSRNIGPVSYTELFRYVQLTQLFAAPADWSSRSFATRFELMLDFIGLIAAAGAGAAQVCRTISIKCLVGSAHFSIATYDFDLWKSRRVLCWFRNGPRGSQGW